MKKYALVFPFVLISLVSCETKENPSKSPQKDTLKLNNENPSKKSFKRNPLSGSVIQSFEEDMDRQITQKIRKNLMNDKTLTLIARNITVITEDGVVTIRGKVTTENEKERIAQKINLMPHIVQLNNKLEVAKDYEPILLTN